MNRFLIPILILSTCSCSKEEPRSAVVEKDKFESVYVELLDSAQVIQSAPTDSTLSPVAERILKRHEIPIEQFKATVRFYNADAKKWKEFFEDVVKRIDERRNKKTQN